MVFRTKADKVPGSREGENFPNIDQATGFLMPASLVYRELEPRIVFDGAIDATVTEVSNEVSNNDSSDGFETETNSQSAGSSSIRSDTNELVEALMAFSGEEKPLTEIVFIDESVDGFEQLIGSIDPAFEIILLQADVDGVEQMAEALSNRTDIGAIHIISHGNQAELFLGTAKLTLDSINGEYLDELTVIGNALGKNADILIYGCNFGEGDIGQQAALRLAELTGADVAASDDLTGNESLGGDWELETQAGTIESSIAVSDEVQAEWQHLLSSNTLESYDPGFGSLAGCEVKSGQSWGQTFSYNSSEGTYSVDQIDVVLNKSESVSGNIDVSLRSSWNGAVIGSATIAANSLSTSEAWYSFDIGSVVLNDNTTYYIRVDSSSSGKTFLGVDSSGSYSNGDLIDKDGNSQSGKDAAFRIVDINYPPVITSNGGGATANVNAAENQTAVTTITSTDVDGDTPV
ncbi:MAG: DUF4347 domain-containing protein, partial [Hyphomicrobiales bacterium]|nr:DUF4347 domain-containing protein [Hyphomicrobiales bacterium]